MSFITKKNVATVAGKAKMKAPVLELVNQELSKEFGDASGDVVYARINGYGAVVEGETDFTDEELAINQSSVPVAVTRIATAARVSSVDNAIKIGSFKEDVAVPRGANMADSINRKIVDAGLAGATMAIVSGWDAAKSVQSINYATLSYAIAAVRQSKMEGVYGGIIPAMMHAGITASSASNNFTPSEKFADAAWEGVIGKFNQTNFVEIETGTLVTGSVVKAANTITIAEPVNNQPYSVATISAGDFDNIAVGTVMNLTANGKSAYTVDVFGNRTANLFAVKFLGFIGTPASTTTIKVTPVYYGGDSESPTAALKNIDVFGETLTSSTDFTTVKAMEASKIYHQGIIFSKSDLLWVAQAVMPLQATDKASANVIIPGIPLTMSIASEKQGRSEIARWDFLGGAKSLRGIGSVAIYSQASA